MAFLRFLQKDARKPIEIVPDMGSECGGLCEWKMLEISGDVRRKRPYIASMLHVSWHVVRYGSNCSLDCAAIAKTTHRRAFLPACTSCIAAYMLM